MKEYRCGKCKRFLMKTDPERKGMVKVEIQCPRCRYKNHVTLLGVTMRAEDWKVVVGSLQTLNN